MRRRKHATAEPQPPVADRTWSARTDMHARDAAGKDLVRFTAIEAFLGRPLDVPA